MQIGIESGTDANGRTVLTVSGAIDVQSRDRLGAAGREVLTGGADALVLDLAKVTFIDSTGIGTLIELGHDAEDVNARQQREDAEDEDDAIGGHEAN